MASQNNAKVEPITRQKVDSEPDDVLEPYSRFVKPLRRQVEQTPMEAQPLLTNYLLVKVIDELVGVRFSGRRK